MFDTDTENLDWTFDTLSFDARENLLGFFSLLLKVDMRHNPQLYKKDCRKEKGTIC